MKLRIFIFSFAVSLLLAEAALHVFGYEQRPLPWRWTAADGGSYALDGRRGWAFRPHYKTINHETDVFGFRIAEGSPPADSARYKIVMLGDSYVYGDGVAADQTVPFHLQELLKKAGYDVAVANAGVPGYSPGQEYIFLQDAILPRLDPSLVVWTVAPNDELDMKIRSLHFLFRGGLSRAPAWTNGIYLQGLIQRATPRWLAGSSFLNLAAASLENFDIVRLIERPDNKMALEKIKRMAEDVERRGVPVLMVRSAGLRDLVDPKASERADFFSGFDGSFRRYLNVNAAIRGWVDREKAEKGTDKLIDELILPESRDPLRHLSPSGNRLTAQAIFDFMAAQGMADQFPRLDGRGR